ncbi:MlaD family protein [Mangrovivirga cuniculi]|uniref:Mce/MlaD domain-containing protein n=1 Tax=Mangrovivirga cuniculi TaxID=2715131 RepID=A0A4D7JLU5_9BACT|nr:MlaD family protein [Mangrovivirga cuniculi]QCK16819.1 hypothetical protein DCC35_19815 [Mangrovivirga cuniculi]
MKDKVKLGLFVFLGVMILILGLYFVGARENLFSSSLKVNACFSNAAGIQKGSAVQFVGIHVGSVEEINIIDDSTVCLTMRIDEEQAKFITKDAIAQIGSEGLMGNKLVSISPGSAKGDNIEDGDRLSTKEPVKVEAIMESVMENSKNLEKFTANLAKISEDLLEGKGLAGKLLTDTTSEDRIESIITEMQLVAGNLHNVSRGAEDVVTKISDGEGTLGKLVYDESMSKDVDKMMDSLSQATYKLNLTLKNLSEFSKKMNEGEGAAAMLVNDTTMAENLNKTIIEAKQRTVELERTIDIINESWILNLFDKNKNNPDRGE